MSELGAVYGEVKGQHFLVYKTAIHLSVVFIVFAVLCYFGYKWYKENPKDKILIIGYSFFITGFLLVGIVNNLYTYEETFMDKYRDVIDNDVEHISLYSDIETNKVNVFKVKDTYYFIEDNEVLELDSVLFESRLTVFENS